MRDGQVLKVEVCVGVNHINNNSGHGLLTPCSRKEKRGKGREGALTSHPCIVLQGSGGWFICLPNECWDLGETVSPLCIPAQSCKQIAQPGHIFESC